MDACLLRLKTFVRLILIGFVCASCVMMIPPGLAADNYQMGLSAYRAGRYAQAIEYLQKSISENPPETMKLFYPDYPRPKTRITKRHEQALRRSSVSCHPLRIWR